MRILALGDLADGFDTGPEKSLDTGSRLDSIDKNLSVRDFFLGAVFPGGRKQVSVQDRMKGKWVFTKSW